MAKYKCAGRKRLDEDGDPFCTHEADRPWTGRCPGCGRFYDCEKIGQDKKAEAGTLSAKTLAEYKPKPRLSTGIKKLDRVLGGSEATGYGFPQKCSFLLTGGPGAGKCLGRGTPVLRYDGSIVPVEDIRSDDLLMGPDSKPRRVQSTTVGVGPLFRIIPVKGEPWVCNDVHVLTLVDSGRDNVFDIPLDAYLRHTGSRKVRWKLFQPDRIDFDDSTFTPADRPITPYFVGVWLGDGTKELRCGELKGVDVSKPDAEIVAACYDEAARFGLRISNTVSDSGCPTWNIVGEKGRSNPLLNAVRALMRDGIRVPAAYRFASADVRAEVLAGLLDTDGHLDHGGYEFVQKNTLIADDAAFIARSLGFRVSRSTKIVNGEIYVRLYISGDASWLPMRISRKKASPRRQIKNVRRTGFSVEAIGDGEYFGFTLDGDGRFLLGDFTVTHNTTLLLQIMKHVAASGDNVMYVSGEQSIDDVVELVQRIGVQGDKLHFRGMEGDVYKVCEEAEDELKPRFFVLDSLMTSMCTDTKADEGSAEQCRAVGNFITAWVKRQKYNIVVVIIAHVNKNEMLAGPKSVEHLVDGTLHLERLYPQAVYPPGKKPKDAEYRVFSTGDKYRAGPSGASLLLDMPENEGLKPVVKRGKKKKSRLHGVRDEHEKPTVDEDGDPIVEDEEEERDDDGESKN